MRKARVKAAAWIPAYSLVPLVLAVAFNMAVYGGARMLTGGWKHYNIESSFDRLIPFWPPSAAVYLGCYLFWCVNYVLIARGGKKEVCEFFAGDLLSRAVCFLCFCVFPTTNIRPEVAPEGFWSQVMHLIYTIDAADNLFPSIHCLVSWFCFIGLRGRRDIPDWYKAASCIMAVLVCISTLTTKQHVILDVIGGVLLAEICLRLGKRPLIRKSYEKLISLPGRKVSGWKGDFS